MPANSETGFRPYITVILAISADGKIADHQRSAARFGSSNDKHHLESQISHMDGVLLGASTLRAYGTSLRVMHRELLQQRQEQGKPFQPVQIVCSRQADFDPQIPFFRQPFPRWLLTTAVGAKRWQHQPGFDRILTGGNEGSNINWSLALQDLYDLQLHQLAVLGGGELVASLFAVDCVDELWLTLCPLILGGTNSPTPVAGDGFLEPLAPRLDLLDVRSLDHEVFLHYRVKRSTADRNQG